MTATDDMDSPLELARRAFRDELVDAGLLIPLGIEGLYGRGGEFEAIIDGIDHAAFGQRELIGDMAEPAAIIGRDSKAAEMLPQHIADGEAAINARARS